MGATGSCPFSPGRIRPVTTRRLQLLGLTLLLTALVACGGPRASGVDEPLASPVEATPPAAVSSDPPSLPPAAASDPAPAPSVAIEMTQTDTDWGRIWDALPAGFPVYRDASPSAEAGGDGPVSATFSVPGTDAATIARWLQAELEVATYSTEALSGPLEDGSFVVDSVGEGDCRIETTVTPAGDLTLVRVRYGAACPFM